MQGNSNYPICNATIDTYHEPHGVGSGFASGAGLSIHLVLLSLLDGVPDDDTFFRHTFLGVGVILTSFFSDSITLDPSSRISVVVKLDLLRLLLNPQTFHELNEGFNVWK